MMWLRQLGAFMALPFIVTVAIPIAVMEGHPTAVEPSPGVSDLVLMAIGVALLCAGLFLFGLCVFYFWTRGRGTLAPWDPPRVFVADGPYRYVRNPMITGVILILVGEACCLRSRSLAEWGIIFTSINLIYIPLLEEPLLKHRFGDSYTAYVKAVPRFVPRWRPWMPGPNAG